MSGDEHECVLIQQRLKCTPFLLLCPNHDNLCWCATRPRGRAPGEPTGRSSSGHVSNWLGRRLDPKPLRLFQPSLDCGALFCPGAFLYTVPSSTMPAPQFSKVLLGCPQTGASSVLPRQQGRTLSHSILTWLLLSLRSPCVASSSVIFCSHYT